MGGGVEKTENKFEGFTLIELLAVIIILVIIALITIPITLNVIGGAKKKAFQNTAYGLIDAAKLQSAENYLKDELQDLIYTFPEAEGLKYSGETPKGGTLRYTKDGKSSIAIYNEEWCATKGFEEEEVTILKYEEGECILKEEADIPILTLKGSETIYLTVGLEYKEPGYSVKTVGGEELSHDYVVITIKGQNSGLSEIDTNIEDTYTITYSITYKGNTSSKIRTIHVGNYNPSIHIEPNGSNGYSKDMNVTINVKAYEQYTVDHFTYTITKNEVEQTPITVNGISEVIHLEQDGIYSIKVEVIDSNNNSSTLVSEVYHIDVTPPSINFEQENISIKASEAIGYDLKAGVSVSDNNPISMGNVVVSGELNAIPNDYLITYVAIDIAGNTTTKTRTITVLESDGPIISLTPMNSNDKWIKAQSVSLTANDISGLKSVTYQITKDGVEQATQTVPINDKHAEGTILLDTNGTYTIKVIAIDNNDNESILNSGEYKIDIDKPTIALNVQGSPFNSDGWAKANFNVDVTTSDTGGSNVVSYKYCKGTSNNCTPNTNVSSITGSIEINTESSTNYVCAIALDGAGNESDKVCGGPYKLDKTAPTIRIVSSSSELSTIIVNVSGSDTNSKISKYYYSIDGGSYVGGTSTSKTFSNLNMDTTYTIRVYAMDFAGNTSSSISKSISTQVLTTTNWIFTSNGTFTVPVTGTYRIEMHGGGGGGGAGNYQVVGGAIWSSNGGNGGGSGEVYTTTLAQGMSYDIQVGVGGSGATSSSSNGKNGESTHFGSLYSLDGGRGGTSGYHNLDGTSGNSVGSLASGVSGGSSTGNYGRGGDGGRRDSSGSSGNSGAIIITWISS